VQELEPLTTQISFIAIGIAGILVFLFVLLSIVLKPTGELFKRLLFLGISLPIVVVTIYLASSTIYLNVTSLTKGPVHWHADFEIWDCGQKVNLVKPKGLSNRIGTPILHEHNDDRAHVEGVVFELKDVSLGKFFDVIDGDLDKDRITLPTDNGIVSLKNGDLCGSAPGILQVFVYQTKDKVFFQKKIEDPASFTLSPHGKVPPGDCIIIEFDEPKEKTDKLCNFYKIAKEQGKINGP